MEVHFGKRVSFAVFFLVCFFNCCAGSPEEDRLLTELLKSYQKYGRPGPVDKPLNVEYGLSLLRIDDYCTKTDSITIEAWENYQWTDERLKWDAEAYGGLSSIRLPPDMIWTPDLIPYNGWSIKNDLTRVVVYESGMCSWVPRHFLKFQCDRDDNDISCKLKGGSWTYDGTKLNLTNRADAMDVSSYRNSDQFDLKRTTAVRNVKVYECCPEPYIDITFTMELGLKKPLPSSGVALKSFGILGSSFSGIMTSWLMIMRYRSF